MYIGLSDSEEIIKNAEIINSFDESSELINTHDVKEFVNSNDELSFLVKASDDEVLTNSFDDSTSFLDSHEDKKLTSTCEEICSLLVVDDEKRSLSITEKSNLISDSLDEQRSCLITSCLTETEKTKRKESLSKENSFTVKQEKGFHYNSNTQNDEKNIHSLDLLNSILDTEDDVDEEWSLDREGDFIGPKLPSSEQMKTKTESQVPFSLASIGKEDAMPENDNNGWKKVIMRKTVASSTDKIDAIATTNTTCLLQKTKKPRQRYKVRFFSYPKKNEVDSSQKLNPKKQYFEIHIRRPQHLMNSAELIDTCSPKLTAASLNTHQAKEIKINANEKTNENEKQVQRLMEWKHRRLKSKENSKQYYYKKQNTCTTNCNSFYRYSGTNASNACSLRQPTQGIKVSMKRWISKFFRYLKREKPQSSLLTHGKWVPSLLDSNTNCFLCDLDRRGVISEIHNITQRIHVLTQNECQSPNVFNFNEKGAEEFGTNRSNIFSYSTSNANAAHASIPHRILKRKVVDVARRQYPYVGIESSNCTHEEIPNVLDARKNRSCNDIRNEFVTDLRQQHTHGHILPNFRQERVKTVRFANVKDTSESGINAHNVKTRSHASLDTNAMQFTSNTEDETGASIWSDDFEVDHSESLMEEKIHKFVLASRSPQELNNLTLNAESNTGETFKKEKWNELTNVPFLKVDKRDQKPKEYKPKPSTSKKQSEPCQGASMDSMIFSQEDILEDPECQFRKPGPVVKFYVNSQQDTAPMVKQDNEQLYHQRNSKVSLNQNIQKDFAHQNQRKFSKYSGKNIQQDAAQCREQGNAALNIPENHAHQNQRKFSKYSDIQQDAAQCREQGNAALNIPENHAHQNQRKFSRYSNKNIQQDAAQYREQGNAALNIPENHAHQNQRKFSKNSDIQQDSAQCREQGNAALNIPENHAHQKRRRFTKYSDPKIEDGSGQRDLIEKFSISSSQSTLPVSAHQRNSTMPFNQYCQQNFASHHEENASGITLNESILKDFQLRNDSPIFDLNRFSLPSSGKTQTEKRSQSEILSDTLVAANAVSLRFLETFQEESKIFLEMLFKSFLSKLSVDAPSMEHGLTSRDMINRSSGTDFIYKPNFDEDLQAKGATSKIEVTPKIDKKSGNRRNMSLDVVDNNRRSKSFYPNSVSRDNTKDEAKHSTVQMHSPHSIHRISTNEEEFLMQFFSGAKQESTSSRLQPPDMQGRLTDEEKHLMRTSKVEAKAKHYQKSTSFDHSFTAEEEFLQNLCSFSENVDASKKTPVRKTTSQCKQKGNCNVKNEMVSGKILTETGASKQNSYWTAEFRNEDGPGTPTMMKGDTMLQMLQKSSIADKFQESNFQKKQKKSKIAGCCINPDSAPSPPYNNGCFSARSQYTFHPVIKTYDPETREMARKLLEEANDISDEEHCANIERNKKSALDYNMDTHLTDKGGDFRDEESQGEISEKQLQERRQWAMQMARLVSRGASQRQATIPTHNLRFHPHISKNQLQSEMQNKIIYAHKEAAREKIGDEKETLPAVPLKRHDMAERMGHLNTAVISKIQPSHDDLKAIRNATRCVKEIARQQEYRLNETSNNGSGRAKRGIWGHRCTKEEQNRIR